MTKRIPAAAAAILVLIGAAAALLAVTPQKWTFRTADEFLRGKLDGVTVSADGVLTLAPREEKLEGPAEDFYLSFLMAPDGTAYLGTGHEGRIYKIGKDGKAELFSQTTEMDVTCLAVDRKGVLYAGTSPNGKIYKISAAGKAEEFFNPNEKYIWSLFALDDGSFLAAVGESGGIYAVSAQGAGKMIFKARENHVLCLRLDRNRDIIAGTGGNGLVYRISTGGKVTVVFETPFEEVRTLAFDLDGNIYAAAGGSPMRGRSAEPVPSSASGREADVLISVSAVAAASGGGAASQVPPSQAQAKVPAPSVAALREGGALFRVSPDGLGKIVWASPEEMIYSLFWDEGGKKVVFGTGPKGRLYSADADENATLIVQSASEQVYELVPVGVRTYLLGNNPCSLSILHPDMRSSGEYTGPVLDARMISSWGRISWEATVPEGAACRFQTRSGNSAEPGPSWSDWSPPYQKSDGEAVLSPKARYIQVKAILTASTGRFGPALSKAELFYLQTNVAPVVSRVDLLPVNDVFLKLPGTEEAILGIESRKTEEDDPSDDLVRIAVGRRRVQRKGYQTVRWDADDPNEDTLSYTLSLRLESEKTWRVLEDGWTESTYAFDTVNFPDGIYLFKVTASDLLSNPRAQALSGEKASGLLVIDNTAPAVKAVTAAKEANGLNVSFAVEDALLPIKEARYLVRPDDWRVIFPEDGICDSKVESFKFRVPLDAKADGLLTITVKDAAGNTAVVKRNF
jgi:hypothetical protein